MAAPETALFEPRRPTLAATGLLSLWVGILSLPMFAGRFIAPDATNDQYAAGYAFRQWLADQFKATGEIPLWNPNLFGGMPFVGAMHGDIFYPTAWLRLILPTHIAMDLGFVVHYVLAGLFLYLLLRRLGVSWTGAVTGGLAYQLSGVVASLVSPGHDGKLFVTALMPLALLALVLAIRERRPVGYSLLALTVGLGILSPHYQMVYYMLIVAGLFSLYLAFGAGNRPAPKQALQALGFAFGAVLVGFGIGAIQLIPFYHYVPLSPRAESYGGFAAATSWAIPWSHVPEFFLAGFTGSRETYWSANFGKLHSEYLGLPVVALAVFGAMHAGRRRLAWWLAGIGALFLLIALGAATPFYQVWYSVMPFVKQTRAPGMAFFVVAMVVATFAAFGVERLERREGNPARWWLGVGGAVAVLGLLGVFGAIASTLAEGIEAARLRSGSPTDTANLAQSAIRIGAALSGLTLVLLGALVWAQRQGRVPVIAFALGLCAIVGTDLWRGVRGFWSWSESPTVGLYAGDGITRYLQQQTPPFRVMDFSDSGLEIYPGSSLMAFGIPQLLGHHGNQLHAFNQVLGGKNEWSYLLQSRRLWDLFAVQYVLVPADFDLGTHPQLPAWRNLAAEFDTVFANVTTSSGRAAHLLERRNPVPYAWVVAGAVPVPDDRGVPLVADPRSPLAFDQVVLTDPASTVPVDSLAAIPEPLAITAVVDEWRAGHMRIRLEPQPTQDAWVVVAENWYPEWTATADGRAASVGRGNMTLLTVRVPAGTREVELRYASADYARGRLVTYLSLGLVIAGFVAPVALRRRRG